MEGGQVITVIPAIVIFLFVLANAYPLYTAGILMLVIIVAILIDLKNEKAEKWKGK